MFFVSEDRVAWVGTGPRQLRYFEVAECVGRRASKFCQGVVIPQIGAVPARQVWTDFDLGRVVAAWLWQFELPLTFYYDYKLDRHFLLEALRGAEDWRVPRAPGELGRCGGRGEVCRVPAGT